jgi:hypothetical protein
VEQGLPLFLRSEKPIRIPKQVGGGVNESLKTTEASHLFFLRVQLQIFSTAREKPKISQITHREARTTGGIQSSLHKTKVKKAISIQWLGE